MDLKDQLKSLFPEHKESEEKQEQKTDKLSIWMQSEPLECHFIKRKGKPLTIIKKYNGASSDFKILTKELKKHIGVGGTYKNEEIIIQGDYREKIVHFLNEIGFNTKRVGG